MHDEPPGDADPKNEPDPLALIKAKYDGLELNAGAGLPVTNRTLVSVLFPIACGFGLIEWAGGNWVTNVSFGVISLITVLLVWRTKNADQKQQK
jgi:hypothetical protein